MSLDQIKNAIKDELLQGAVDGSEYDENDEEWYNEAVKAANEIEPSNPEQTTFFNDLEEFDEENESVYAFFVFVEIE